MSNNFKFIIVDDTKDKKAMLIFTWFFRIVGFGRLKKDDKEMLFEKLGKGDKG